MQRVSFLKFYTAYADDKAQAQAAENPATEKSASPAMTVDASRGYEQEPGAPEQRGQRPFGSKCTRRLVME